MIERKLNKRITLLREKVKVIVANTRKRNNVNCIIDFGLLLTL